MQSSTPAKEEFLAAILSEEQLYGKGSKGFGGQQPEHRLAVCSGCKKGEVSWAVLTVD